MKRKIISSGGYCDVYEENGKAVKRFKRDGIFEIEKMFLENFKVVNT